MARPRSEELEAPAQFDLHAEAYAEELRKGVSLSGETPLYFAERRVSFLQLALDRLGCSVRDVMDFGCGVGWGMPLLHRALNPRTIVGVDSSSKSLDLARKNVSVAGARFANWSEALPPASFDLIYSSGVFHHIQPAERSEVLLRLRDSLRDGGIFALWENNPWNPGTRLIMSRIPFDRHANPISARACASLMSSCGFEVLETSFHFVFPSALKWFRGMESWFSAYPFGAQYVVIGRKRNSIRGKL